MGISAALRAREVTGRGQWVETSLHAAVAYAAGVLAYAVRRGSRGPEHFMSWIGDSRAPKGLFECKDGRWVHALGAASPRFVLSAGAGDRDQLLSRISRAQGGSGACRASEPQEIFVLAPLLGADGGPTFKQVHRR